MMEAAVAGEFHSVIALFVNSAIQLWVCPVQTSNTPGLWGTGMNWRFEPSSRGEMVTFGSYSDGEWKDMSAFANSRI